MDTIVLNEIPYVGTTENYHIHRYAWLLHLEKTLKPIRTEILRGWEEVM